MRDFHIGDRVTFFGRAYFVRGFSPMSIDPPTIHLEDAQTGELVEVAIDDLIGRSSATTDGINEPGTANGPGVQARAAQKGGDLRPSPYVCRRTFRPLMLLARPSEGR